MSPATVGALLGGCLAAGLLLVAARLRVMHRPQLATRVLPYVRDLPQVGRTPALSVASTAPVSAAAAVFGPPMRSAADLVERILGGATSVRRRLERANLDRTVQEFRLEQVVWGLVFFVLAAVVGVLEALRDPRGSLATLLLCGVAFAAGVIVRDNYLTSQVRRRERRITAEFPTLAELLALAVAAGEGPVAALDRVAGRSVGELSVDLRRVLAAIRTGEPVGAAFDTLAATTGVPQVARFAQGVAVAVERGTPLADVLHAQAADVREAGRRDLIEAAARKEVLMMVPVVVVGLSLTTP